MESTHSPLGWREIIALILAVASMSIDNSAFVGICLLLAASIGCWGVVTHHRPWKTPVKIIVCAAVIEGTIGLFFYLRAAALEKELQQYRGTLYAAELPAPKSPCTPNPKSV